MKIESQGTDRGQSVRRAMASKAVLAVLASFALAGCAADATGTGTDPQAEGTGSSEANVASETKASATETKVATPEATASATETKISSEKPVDQASLGTVLGGVVNGVGQTLGICSPLTCCFPSGQEWDGSPFENSLQALGCTMPRAYTEAYGASDWWMYSQCPLSAQLLTVIAKNATVAPVYSQIAINECLVLDSLTTLNLNSIFVQWDPTCSSCKAVSK